MKLVFSSKQTLPIDSTDTLHLEMVLTCTVVNPILAKSALDAFLACHLRKAYTLYMRAVQSGKKYPVIDISECVPSDLVTIEMVQVHCKTNKAVNGNKFQRSEAGCALEDTVPGEDINAFIAGLWQMCFAMTGVDVIKTYEVIEVVSAYSEYDDGYKAYSDGYIISGAESTRFMQAGHTAQEDAGDSNDPSPIPQGDDKPMTTDDKVNIMLRLGVAPENIGVPIPRKKAIRGSYLDAGNEEENSRPDHYGNDYSMNKPNIGEH